MRTELQTITPDIAQNLLATNDGNRPLSVSTIAAYKEDMLSGMWRANGETIKLDEHGRLLDGQHRLAACVAAGRPFTTLVAYDVPRDTFNSIDMGRRRSLQQFLAIQEEHNPRALAAALLWLHRYEQGKVEAKEKVSVRYLQEVTLAQHPGIRNSVAETGYWAKLAGPEGGVIMCHYLMSQKDPTLAALFFAALKDGKNIDETEPVYLLRERILKRGSARYTQVEITALLIKAWNATRCGQAMRQLKWQGEAGEAFPKIV